MRNTLHILNGRVGTYSYCLCDVNQHYSRVSGRLPYWLILSPTLEYNSNQCTILSLTLHWILLNSKNEQIMIETHLILNLTLLKNQFWKTPRFNMSRYGILEPRLILPCRRLSVQCSALLLLLAMLIAKLYLTARRAFLKNKVTFFMQVQILSGQGHRRCKILEVQLHASPLKIFKRCNRTFLQHW